MLSKIYSDPFKIKEFEHYAKLWIPLVEKFGGNRYGYFLPHKDAGDIALVLFSFPSLAYDETYRKKPNQTLSAKQP